MRKTIWIPLMIGGALGLLDFISLAVDFLIPLGPFGATGPQEILLSISAALGGPLGALVASVLQELGAYFFWLKTQFPPEQMLTTGVLFSIADFSAHLLALLTISFGYKFMQQLVKKAVAFLVGWILIVVVYYTLLVFLQSSLIGLVVPVKHSLSTLFQNNLPEFLAVLIVTTLIWVALPRRYHRPMWYEALPAALPNETTAQDKENSK